MTDPGANARVSADHDARLRGVYVADTMIDVRMADGLARHVALTVVTAKRLGRRFANDWPPKVTTGIEVVTLPGSRVTWVGHLAAWLIRHRRSYDVAFVLDNLTAALGANLARRLGGPPVVLQLGRPTLDYLRCQRRRRALGRWRYLARYSTAVGLVAVNERLADAIGGVSTYVARQSAKRNRNVRMIPWYGVDTESFAPRWSKTDARRLLGLPEERPVVLHRSRLAPEKDPETFLDAVCLLRSEGRCVTAAYMGGEQEEMSRLARDRGVELVSRAPASREEIPIWYVAADVDVQTSLAEGLGVSPLESLACGRPVVVSDVGGLPEVVDGGRVGALVPVRDAKATAAAIARFLDDPDLAEDIGREGRRWVETRFGSNEAFEDWVALGRSVARSPAVSERPHGAG